MSERFLLSGASYRNFIETIHSPFSRVNYKNSLSLYMQFRKIDNCNSLVTEDPKIIQDSLINYILYLREEMKIASSTISTRIAILRKFYDCNEIELKWKKIKSYIGKSKSIRYNGKKDRPYTSMEILKMLEKADERERVVILLMANWYESWCSTLSKN
jgi:hypothetical protein